MACAGEMFVRVSVFGIVAATHMAAGPAQPQVNPVIAHGKAFHTTVPGRTYRLHRAQVGALFASVHLNNAPYFG
jgi:hypothetical protein